MRLIIHLKILKTVENYKKNTTQQSLANHFLLPYIIIYYLTLVDQKKRSLKCL